jgi:hypothetical protein
MYHDARIHERQIYEPNIYIRRIFVLLFVCLWRYSPQWARASSFVRFLDHTQRRTTVGRTPLGRVISSSQRPLPDNTQLSQQTNIHAPGGIRTHNLSRRAVVDLRLRARGFFYCTAIYSTDW